jgi:hypothetical protein
MAKIKVFTVTPGVRLAPCIEKDPKNLMVWLEEAQPGEVIQIRVSEMEEEEFKNLPEYMGP